MPYVLLILMAGLMSLGQILFKLGATKGGVEWSGFSNILGFILSLALNVYVWLTLIVYAVAFGLWFVILSRANLSTAFPLLTASVILVVIFFSWALFGESITLIKAIASAFIILGVLLLSLT